MLESFATERLNLRPMTTDDLSHLIELNGDAEVMRFITGRALQSTETEHDLNSTIGNRWLLFRASDDGFLGWVGATANAAGEFDIGWRLRRRAWGQGFATEAAMELVNQLFRHGAPRVFAETMAVNVQSRAVMERIGMTYVRTFHLEFDDPLPGTDLGEVEYELTRTTWQQGSQR